MDTFGRKRIAQLEESLATQQRLFDIQQMGWKDMEARWNELAKKMDTQSVAMARIIAKLDTKFAESELTPERRAESDRIGEEVLKRLVAEAKARAPYNET